MDIDELYEQLANRSRQVQGELTIDGFEDADYEELYEQMLTIMAPYIGHNYDYWYGRACIQYHRYKERHSTRYDFYDPHMRPLSEQTIREQLAVLKWKLYRWYYGTKPQLKEA